ncbi:MAG: hypothetical protein JJ863_20335 [Deltaproteobacteria bacterium]|nr:hypothetical protein [Deltaproteobacteria bacterium]
MDRLVRRSVGWAYLVGLDRRPPIRLLDLGCHYGLFLHACGQFGHEAVGLDLPDPLRERVAERLGVTRLEHRITPEHPAPDLATGFDLFTGFNVTFNGHATPTVWGPREWDAFTSNLRAMANPGARLWLRLHPNRKTGHALTPVLKQWFQHRGAWIRPRAGMVSLPLEP